MASIILNGISKTGNIVMLAHREIVRAEGQTTHEINRELRDVAYDLQRELVDKRRDYADGCVEFEDTVIWPSEWAAFQITEIQEEEDVS